MKISLQPLAALIITCIAFSANAQDQSSSTNSANIALAVHLVDLMHLDKAMNVGLNSMKQMQSKILDAGATNSSPDTAALVKKSMESSMGAATALMTPEKLHSVYVSVYARIFTTEELQGAIDFYKSPIGQKWVDKQPQVSIAIMEQTMAMMPKMSQMMDSVKKSMGTLDALRKNTNSILSNLLPPALPSATPTN